MFGLFKTREVADVCSMCKTYKSIDSLMGDEFCYVCLNKRIAMVEGIIQSTYNQPERSKREETHRGHTLQCIPYRNTCYHTADFKDKCPYKEHCEFVNPIVMRCSEHCSNAVREVQ